MIDLRQTEEYGDYMEAIGWHVVELKSQTLKVKAYVRKVPIIGNIAKIQRPEKIPTRKKLESLAKTHSLAALYLEPTTNHQPLITNHQFSLAKSPFVPAKTIHLDLHRAEKELFNRMKKNTRYSIRKGREAGVKIKESKNIDRFIKLWHETARKRGMFLPQSKEIRALWHAFGKKAHLLIVHPGDYTLIHRSVYFRRYIVAKKPIAGVLIIRTPEVGYYMYAASTKEGNKLFAPTLLAWEAIRLAKKKKCKIFDFEGIYDERYPETKKWQGFTRFKKGFGGKVITYPRTLVKYYNPFAKILNL